jgi:acetylornithine deacetylase/succinyl-diaminopimelate desuccinylase-like protein
MAVELLRDLVATDSAEPSGSLGCVKILAERLRAGGFSDRDVQILAPAEHPEKANLVVRLHGRGSSEPLLWMAHLDVVSADPADWSVPPFQLTDSDGWYYGRGTGDMKGEVAALVTTLIRLKSEGYVPRHDLIAAFTADEEAEGHANGVAWLLATHRSLLDAQMAFDPDAGGGGLRDGEPIYYRIETAEKTYATYSLTITNKGGHSSQPEPDNAIYRLSAALLKVAAARFPMRLTATTRAFLGAQARLEADPLRRDILALLSAPPDPGAVERLSAHPQLNAQIRTTCVATQLAAGSAENALPQRAQATVQCRLLPGDSSDAVLAALRASIDDPLMAVELTRAVNSSPETVPDPRVINSIRRAVDSMWPRLPVLVNMDAGGSDAIFTRAAGIPTYGAASIFADVYANRHHGRDERIGKSAFAQGVELNYRLVKQVDKEL